MNYHGRTVTLSLFLVATAIAGGAERRPGALDAADQCTLADGFVIFRRRSYFLGPDATPSTNYRRMFIGAYMLCTINIVGGYAKFLTQIANAQPPTETAIRQKAGSGGFVVKREDTRPTRIKSHFQTAGQAGIGSNAIAFRGAGDGYRLLRCITDPRRNTTGPWPPPPDGGR